MALHIPGVDKSYKNPYTGKWYNLHMFLHDFALFLFEIAFTIFFREVQVRGSSNVPPKGNPAILVCAPHANQFIDPTLVMAELSKLPGRRSRRACFVTAAVSISKPLVGVFAKWTGSIPIDRATDNFKDVDANVQLYCPDYDKNPLLYKVRARDPNIPMPDLRKLFTKKSLIGLPNYLSNAQLDSIPEADTLLLVKPFRNTPQIKDLVTRGTNFKYAAKVDNTAVFQNVFNHLHTKGMVGIFPEGGSHDRPSLLPIKAGVAIMALGAVAVDPSMPIRILPCGLNYFHRHKFRSRAVIEFGEPIVVDGAEGEKYIQDPRGTVSDLLDRITQALYSVTINADDYDTLMLIQATRRLYQPRSNDGRTSLSEVVEMNRRLLTGYTKCKDDPRVKSLMKDVQEYNSTLYSLGLKDHQVDKLKSSNETVWHTLRVFLLRLFQLLTFIALALPGAVLFSPIFITCHYFSQKKAREALRKSFVKIKGDDLLATWKLFVALCMGPTLYITYSLVLTFLSYKYLGYNSIGELLKGFVYYYAILVATTYASFRIGERGVDLFKSLPPLFISLIYPTRKIEELKCMRSKLSNAVTDVITSLGPVFFPDMEVHEECQASDTHSDLELNSDEMPSESPSSSCLSDSISSQASNAISKINSRGSLADIPILGEDVNIVRTELLEEEFEYVGFPSSKISNMVIKNRTHKDKYD